jgi:hypothetical protein
MPKYFFNRAGKIGFIPIPTATEESLQVMYQYAKAVNNIAYIPLKFQVAATLFVVHMALAKERQFAKSQAVYQAYLNHLNIERTEVAAEKVSTPLPQDHYVLKLVTPQIQGQ